MSFSVNTNANALIAIQTLSSTNKSLATTQSRINSGLRVEGAKDDASTFAIAQGMRGDIAGFKAISDSLALGESTVNVALKAAESISDLMNKVKAKVVQAQESNVDRAAINRDIQQYIDQIDDIAAAAQFNGVNLINDVTADSSLDAPGGSQLSVLGSLNRTSASTMTTSSLTVDYENLTATGLGIDGIDVTNATVELVFDSTFVGVADNEVVEFTVGTDTYTFEFIEDPTTTAPTDGDNIVVQYDSVNDSPANLLAKLKAKMEEEGFSVSYNASGNMEVTHKDGIIAADDATSDVTGFVSGTAAGGDPTAAVTTVETSINNLKKALSRLGAAATRLEVQGDFVKKLTDTMEIGVGQLVDADLAAESALLQSLQVKQQLGMQALSIANQQPGSVLALFR
ncbi:MAG: flagellin [Rhodospirillales bacterium]|nr:flagellin [Rhodospirillales bacterium]